MQNHSVNHPLLNEAPSDGKPELHQQGSKRFLVIITLFAAVGGFLFGYDTGVISGALLFIANEYHLSKVEQEAIVSMALVGAIIGSFIGGPVSDLWGRKPTIIGASLLFAAGSVVLAVAQNVAELLIGRFIVGTGIGVAANIVPIFVAEVAPTNFRGALVTVNVLCITSGQFISYLVDSAFTSVTNGWRYMLGLAALPAVIQLIGMLFLVPESPRWLLHKHKDDQAKKVLQRIRGGADVTNELLEMEHSLQEESGGFRDLFKRSTFPALMLGIALQASQQFCGINTAMYYSPTIIKMAGVTNNSTAIWFSDAVALTNAVFTVVSVFLIDRVGRRKLLLSSIVGLVFGLTCLGFSFMYRDKLGESGGVFSVISLAMYTAFFAVGMGPVPWAVNSEIYPTNVRGLANGVATTVNWTANLLVSMTFLSYVELVTEAGAFWTYAGIGVASWLLFFFVLPETKGKSIEEIQAHFTGKGHLSVQTDSSQK